MLRSIKCHKKILQARTTLQANDNVPMSDSSWHLVCLDFSDSMKDCSSAKMVDLCSSEILAVIDLEFMTIPRKVISVVGVTTFCGLIGALIWWHSWIMEFKFSSHSVDPAVRKLSR